jgi:hypothetical protein
MRKLLLLISVLALAAYASAGTYYWDDGGGDDLWMTASNWDSDTLPVSGFSGDTARIFMAGTVNIRSQDLTAGSKECIVDGDSTGSATLNIAGKLNAGHHVKMGFFESYNTGHIQIDGGTLLIENKDLVIGACGFGSLQMTDGYIDVQQVSGLYGVHIGSAFRTGYMSGGGHLDLWGGTINVAQTDRGVGLSMRGEGMDDASFQIPNMGRPGTMDITDGIMVLYDDDGSIRNRINGYIDSGWIYSTAGGGIVPWCTWDSSTNTTTLWADIPEPATIALLGFGGLILLRRRK